MSNISKVLSLLIEKPVEVSDDDYMEFGEDFGVSVNKKLYARAIGIGMSKDTIAKLAKEKGNKLETEVKTKEDKAKDRQTVREYVADEISG